jgi:hypothetical protein
VFIFGLAGQDDFGDLHPVIIGIFQTAATVIAYLIFIQIADFALATVITVFFRFQQAFTDQFIVSPFFFRQKGEESVGCRLGLVTRR